MLILCNIDCCWPVFYRWLASEENLKLAVQGLWFISGATWLHQAFEPVTPEGEKIKGFLLLLSSIRGMAFPQSLSILFIGHSSIARLTDYCTQHNISNFGLPLHFNADAMALPGASLQDLPCLLEVVHRCPHAPRVSILWVAHAFHAFLHLL